MCTPECAHQAVGALGLMFEEQKLLAKRDVVWRLYDAYQLELILGCSGTAVLAR